MVDNFSRRQRVIRVKAREFAHFEEGVKLERYFGVTLQELRFRAEADRLELAEHFMSAAVKISRVRGDFMRSAVSRYYYAMYHAFRSVVYANIHGDDHEDHQALAKAIPDDFPDQAKAQNDLKNARLLRNEADYEPYFEDESAFRASAKTLSSVAPQYLDLARDYVRGKGNPLI